MGGVLLAFVVRDIGIFIVLFAGSKSIDFSWGCVPERLVFCTCESRLSGRFSRDGVFLPILLEFSGCLLAVFGVVGGADVAGGVCGAEPKKKHDHSCVFGRCKIITYRKDINCTIRKHKKLQK